MSIKSILSSIYKKYGENPGTMLLHTGTAGWILSCLAQIGAIVTNDKIAPEQKTFLIPQELGDGLINILSFYVLTSSVKTLCSKAVLNGKIANKAIKNYLQKNKLADKIGKTDFNIKETNGFGEIKEDFNSFKNGVDILASTVGSVLSCNILTPILRNEYAAKQQKVANTYLQNKNSTDKQQPLASYHRVTMAGYQSKIGNSGMKI